MEQAVQARPQGRYYTPEQLDEIGPRLEHKVTGPRALSGSLRDFVVLVWMLAYLEFKLKFFGSILGYAWQLVRPLMMFGVLYFVFTEVIPMGDGVAFYPVCLLSAIVIYSFFAEATTGAVSSVVAREGLIRKISFPVLTAPLSTVTSVFLTVVLNYLVVLGFALASGIAPTWGWLWIAPMLLGIYLISVSVGVGLSALYVHFRDVRPIWEVVTQVFFYATPVIYTIEYAQQRSEFLAKLMMCNPIAAIIQQLRHSVIDPAAPSPAEVLGGGANLLIPVAIAIAIAVGGFLLMRSLAPRLAERL
jgi:ABC-2 type transport system permease protein